MTSRCVRACVRLCVCLLATSRSLRHRRLSACPEAVGSKQCSRGILLLVPEDGLYTRRCSSERDPGRTASEVSKTLCMYSAAGVACSLVRSLWSAESLPVKSEERVREGKLERDREEERAGRVAIVDIYDCRFCIYHTFSRLCAQQ